MAKSSQDHEAKRWRELVAHALLLAHGTNELSDVQRVPTGAFDRERMSFRESTARLVPGELVCRLGVQWAEFDACSSRLLERRDKEVQLGRTRRGPGRREDANTNHVEASKQLAHHRETCGVRPMEILERQHERPLERRSFQQVDRTVRQDEPGSPFAKEVLKPQSLRMGGLVAGRAQRFEHQAERAFAFQFVSATSEDLGRRAREHGVEQGALANAGLSLDEESAA